MDIAIFILGWVLGSSATIGLYLLAKREVKTIYEND